MAGEFISQHIILPTAAFFLQFTFQHVLHSTVFEFDVVSEIRFNLFSLNSTQTLLLCFSSRL